MSSKILKTKWGREIDISQFQNEPYGAFKKYVRNNIDSDWGIDYEGGERKYCVSFTGTATVFRDVEVIADSKDDAIDKATKIIEDDVDNEWDISNVDEYRQYHIEEYDK